MRIRHAVRFDLSDLGACLVSAPGGDVDVTPSASLKVIKLAHTVVWAFFVACIIGAPLAAYHGEFTLAALLVGLVTLEAIVLTLNRWSCPLTDMAARYTERREANFDIYLPMWLAKYNKAIFTPLYLLGAAYTVYAWCNRG